MIRLMATLGCVALLGNGTMARAEEMAPGAENDERTLTINFIGQRSSAVTLYYKVYKNGAGTLSAMILMESLKRKLAEIGFERSPSNDGGRDAVHSYSIFIVGDTAYSEEAGALEKREGRLLVIILKNEKLAAVNTAPAKGSAVEYRRMENMADEIVARLLFHSYI